MGRPAIRAAVSAGIALLALAVLGMAPAAIAPSSLSLAPEAGSEERGNGREESERLQAGEGLPVCFWSAQGPVCVRRMVGAGAAGLEPDGLLATLLAGPTAEERAQGLWSAVPPQTTLDGVAVRPDLTVVVRLRVPLDALHNLSHETFEAIVEQIGWTLAYLDWRDLRIETWDPTAERFVPLAAFLPEIPAPRKEPVLSGEQAPALAPAYVGQPPAPGQGQPQGALRGKTVYVSAGHGWLWNETTDQWRTQRPPYPNLSYDGPIIEDHNNAEAVDQYLLQYLWNAGAQVWPVRERDMNGAEVVVDNDGPGSGAGYSEIGVWATAAITGTGYAGTDYRYTTTVTGTPTAVAVWTATLPVDGHYAVYVWYRPGSERALDARYTIHHAGGETTVVVDQRHHGITWHYIGTYGFRGGEAVTVTLGNLSSQPGRIVVADAIRFGGGTFDDLADIETVAPYPPDEPWWEVAAFYYAQRMGMGRPPGDVTARPIYARWEHAGTGDDAVYVSWHTNGFAGYQEVASGTETYVHNGEWLTRTEGSVDLRHAIHTELVHDIRAGWDPAWSDRGEKYKNLGELRLLWDEDPSVRMPGALVEIAFHDHPSDTDALKEPYFNMLAARALYQGIVHYFEQRDGVDLALVPEPPTHLMLQNLGGGRLRIAWQPSPTDAIGLVGDAATGYRVYTSADGLGWSNGLAVTATTTCTLTGLSEGQLLFVRVSGTNDGGESFPTESLAVRVGDGAGVLLVSGFDRLNRTMAVPETDPVEGYNERLLLGQMNRYDYSVQHGEVIPYPFDSASNEAVRSGLIDLNGYALVDWILGEESAPDETLDAAERVLLADFLAGGGALFLSGTEVGWHLDYVGADPAFYETVLRADYGGDDAETYTVAPVAGSVFDGLGTFRFDAPGMYDADYPDMLSPVNGSVAALTYSGGLGGTAAVQYEDTADGCERLVYFGFPFETIWPDRRPTVMGRVLDFLDRCLVLPVQTNIVSPVDGSAHRTVPPFYGTAEVGETAGLDRVEVQVQRASDGRYLLDGVGVTGMAWVTGSTWVTTTSWVTAVGSASWTYSLPPLGDDDYDLRARAWTAQGDVDLSPAEVRFTYDTLPPTGTVLITPTGGITIPALQGVTLVWAAVPPDEGSTLAYAVQLDDQLYTTTLPLYSATSVADGPHTWGVQVFDAAGNRSAWVIDDFLVSRHRVWLPLVMRGCAVGGGPCADLLVNGGFESDEGWVLNRLATYDATNVYSGTRSVRVGIPPGEPGSDAYSSVAQTFTMPACATATLRLWAYPIGEGDDPDDYHYVSLRDESGALHALDGRWQSDARDWLERQYDLSAYAASHAGQAVTLYIGARNDGDDDTASLYVDDVALEVCPTECGRRIHER